MAVNENELLLNVVDLKTYFFLKNGIAKAVDGIDFYLRKGETLGMVGESGCGKSVSSLSIMRLIPEPPGKIIGGTINFKGKNLLELNESDMQKIRGNQISMIFQEPMTSLNPVYTIGRQISEVFILHQGLRKGQAISKTVEMLTLVGIPEPERRMQEYPHQMSGGMRQRAMIAMALSCQPDLLIADEPTTALDVTIQAQILELIKELQGKLGMAMLIITHNLGVIAEISERVVVVYAGKVVEHADVWEIFNKAKHPYTIGLLESTPRLDEEQKLRLKVIEGSVPNPLNLPKGCRFYQRCAHGMDRCSREEPELLKVKGTINHFVRCWRYG